MANIYGDRWKIIDSIGEGGQAHTFRVRDLTDDSKNWVLKRLKNKNRLGRFEREIEALKTFDAPSIPKIIDYSVEDSPYIVTKFLGSDLSKFLEDKQININDSLKIFQQIVSAVESAHNKGKITIIHRDIKPNNVIISPDNLNAYLVDFGICQIIGGEQVILTGQEPFGNPAFAAPECYLGREEEPGPECDIYSLGKLWYWMISNGSFIN